MRDETDIRLAGIEADIATIRIELRHQWREIRNTNLFVIGVCLLYFLIFIWLAADLHEKYERHDARCPMHSSTESRDAG